MAEIINPVIKEEPQEVDNQTEEAETETLQLIDLSSKRGRSVFVGAPALFIKAGAHRFGKVTYLTPSKITIDCANFKNNIHISLKEVELFSKGGTVLVGQEVKEFLLN
jgi:hypothetical protein